MPDPLKRSIVDQALRFFKVCVEAEDEQRKRERDDLRFALGGIHQWPDDVQKLRRAQTVAGMEVPARPMISVDVTTEPVRLVLNQERKAHLGINIHPISPDATDDTAEVLQGLYRAIEVGSQAQLARRWGYDRAVKCGRGAYRVDKAYDPEGGHPFDQKIVITRILHQGSVYFDPYAQQPNWSDGRRAIEVIDLPYDQYCDEYPDSEVASFQEDDFYALGNEQPGWIGGDNADSRTVRVVRFWKVDVTRHKLVLLDDHSTAPEHAIPDGRAVLAGDDARYRYEETRTVRCTTVNAHEELDSYKWDGQYIPLIPVVGTEEQPVDGKRCWNGMYSRAKDSARLVNYAASNAIEMAALEPKAPFQLDPKQIKGYETWWQQANLRNWPYLPSHHEADGVIYPRPERTQVDMGRMGPSMQLLSMGRDFVQSATATYDPALGKQPTAHRSGRALIALQEQTVEGTSHYLGDLAEVSMPYEALVVLDLIPHVYDRPGRVARILDHEDKARDVMLNAPFTPDPRTQQPMPYDGADAQQQARDPQSAVEHYDLNKGRYGVTVTIGKSSKSELEQGQTEIGEIMQSIPELGVAIAPLYFKYRDGAGMKEIAKIAAKQRDHLMPWLSDDPQAGDPARLQAENAALKQQLEMAGKAIETKQIEAQGKMEIVKIQEAADTLRNRENNETKLAVAELGAKVDRLTLFLEERARLGVQQHEAQQSLLDRGHDAALGVADAGHERQLAQIDAVNQAALAEQGQAHAVEQIALQPPTPNGSGA